MLQVKKYRLPPSIRGFKVDQILDNTLYLVCVVTRGSSWRGSILGGDPEDGAADELVKLEPLIDFNESGGEADDGDENDVYDLEALETLGLIRTERDASMEFTDDGTSLLSKFPEWMTGIDDFSVTNGTIDLSNYPNSNDTHLMVTKPMLVNLGKSGVVKSIRHKVVWLLL